MSPSESIPAGFFIAWSAWCWSAWCWSAWSAWSAWCWSAWSAWCWSARDAQLTRARDAWRMSHETYGPAFLVPGPWSLVRCPCRRIRCAPGHRARPSRQAIAPCRRIRCAPGHRADVDQAIAPMLTRPSRQAIAPGHRARPSRQATGPRARLSDSSHLAVGFVAPGCRIRRTWRNVSRRV
jgi:hypothetical protein